MEYPLLLKADLKKADLKKANLKKANLKKANLKKAIPVNWSRMIFPSSGVNNQ